MRVQLLPLCCLLGAVLAIAPAVTGQVYSSGASPGYYAYPYYGNGGWNGFNPGIGSTPAGSYLGGLSSSIRAEGQYNLLILAGRRQRGTSGPNGHRKPGSLDERLL